MPKHSLDKGLIDGSVTGTASIWYDREHHQSEVFTVETPVSDSCPRLQNYRVELTRIPGNNIFQE